MWVPPNSGTPRVRAALPQTQDPPHAPHKDTFLGAGNGEAILARVRLLVSRGRDLLGYLKS
jgi:hypothetical protein